MTSMYLMHKLNDLFPGASCVFIPESRLHHCLRFLVGNDNDFSSYDAENVVVPRDYLRNTLRHHH